MSVPLQLAFWWLLFGGTHVLGSSGPVRGRAIRALGLPAFKGIYSLVALATFAPLLVTYWTHRHAGDFIFVPSTMNRHVTETVMLVAILFLSLAQASPHPGTTKAEMSGEISSSVRGIHRVTRHPLNTGFALFGVAHAISNPSVGDQVFWGGFVVYAVASAWHQDRRLLATGPPEFRPFYEHTSAFPFVAIVAGRQRLALRELRLPAIVVGVVLFGAIRWLHPKWIGGFG